MIQLLGVCIAPPMIITQYYPNGNLLSFMQKEKVTPADTLRLLEGIAAGMKHLEREKIVHRDLGTPISVVKSSSHF